MKSICRAVGLFTLSSCLGCGAEMGSGGEGWEDGSVGEVAEGLTYVKSDDVSTGDDGDVTIVDTFKLTFNSGTATKVDGSDDDLELQICIRDASTNDNIDCWSQRNKHMKEGDPFVRGGYFSFRKGRNSSQDYGDFSSGSKSKFKVRTLLIKRDGNSGTWARSTTCTWSSSSKNYNCDDDTVLDEFGASNDSVFVIGDTRVDFNYKISWLWTQIDGTLDERPSSGGGSDGKEWHHFNPPVFYGRCNTIGGRLTTYDGDADLYARENSAPTLSTYDCLSNRGGTKLDECIIDGDHFSVRNWKKDVETDYHLYLQCGGLPPAN